jgi:hypothetical protein
MDAFSHWVNQEGCVYDVPLSQDIFVKTRSV